MNPMTRTRSYQETQESQRFAQQQAASQSVKDSEYSLTAVTMTSFKPCAAYHLVKNNTSRIQASDLMLRALRNRYSMPDLIFGNRVN